MIPNDPMMLYSFLNMKLRDQYSNLDMLCEDLDVSKQEIVDKMKSVNFQYDADKNQFVQYNKCGYVNNLLLFRQLFCMQNRPKQSFVEQKQQVIHNFCPQVNHCYPHMWIIVWKNVDLKGLWANVDNVDAH